MSTFNDFPQPEDIEVFETRCRRCHHINAAEITDPGTLKELMERFMTVPMIKSCEICRGETIQDLVFVGTEAERMKLSKLGK